MNQSLRLLLFMGLCLCVGTTFAQYPDDISEQLSECNQHIPKRFLQNQNSKSKNFYTFLKNNKRSHELRQCIEEYFSELFTSQMPKYKHNLVLKSETDLIISNDVQHNTPTSLSACSNERVSNGFLDFNVAGQYTCVETSNSNQQTTQDYVYCINEDDKEEHHLVAQRIEGQMQYDIETMLNQCNLPVPLVLSFDQRWARLVEAIHFVLGSEDEHWTSYDASERGDS